jgi:hypothetical protein
LKSCAQVVRSLKSVPFLRSAVFWIRLLSAGGFVRRVLGGLLPPWRTVRRWSGRLLGVAALCLAVGLPAVADLARAGTVAGSYHTGYVAIGYVSLGLGVTVPVLYWVLAATLAAATMAGRRIVALGRAVTVVFRQRASQRGARSTGRRPGAR